MPRFPVLVGPSGISFRPFRPPTRSRTFARKDHRGPSRKLSTSVIHRTKRAAVLGGIIFLSLVSPCIVAEVSRSVDREKEQEGQRIEKERKEERKKERSVRKRAKRSREVTPCRSATDDQRRDEEPCVAKECVVPVADCGGRLRGGIRGEFLK